MESNNKVVDLVNSTEKELLLKILEKTDNIKDEISDIRLVQERHENNLQEHMKRSQANEEQLHILKEEVKPILQGLGFLKTVAKVGTTLATLSYAVLKLFFH